MSSADERDPRLGAILVLASQLERVVTLTEPHPQTYEQLATALERVPPQAALADDTSHFAQWMSVAAVAEQDGARRLAQLIVDRVADLLPSALPGGSDEEVVATEQRALCWSRRGRMARIAGDLDDASEWYRQAARSVSKLPWRDARPQAELGLAIVAVDRGNIPEVDRRLTALLARRPAVHVLYRIPAHQLLALAKRKRGDFLAALLHGWSAFDLLDAHDVRRQEVLLTMAEIAAESGDLLAAAHGFDAVLAAGPQDRVRVSALVGAVAAFIGRPDAATTVAASRLAAYASDLEAMLGTSLAPRDEMRALLALAQSAALLDHTAAEHRWLDAAAGIAQRHGYFEQQFRVESLRTTLHADATAHSRASDAPSPAVETSTTSVPHVGQRRHHVFERLASTTLV